MLDDPEFAKLPFDTRKTYVEKGIGEASRFIAERDGGWTPELWQNFGAAAQQARQFVSESETFGETAMRYAGVAGQTIKDLPAIIGTGVVGLSPVLPDGQGGVTGQVPGETLGPALGRNIVGLAASGAAMLSDAEQPLVQKLGALKQQIDQGDFLAHQQGFGGWIDEQNQAVRDTQKQFYGNADWADQNSLLGNEENVKLMQSYLTTRSPQAWEALQANLLRTPFRAKLQADKQALENDTTLGRALAPEARPLISEAADPAELLPGMLAVKKGVQIATKGASAGSRALDVAKGIAGEMLGEQVSATIDNPYLSAAERLQIAKDSLAGSLGLMGVGAGAKAAVQALSPSTINPEPSTNDLPPPNQTPAPSGAPQTPGATPGAAPLAGAAGPLPSTLSRIAQESLVPDLPEDTGELTADEVADLEGVGQTMSDPSTTPPTQTPLTPGERAPADQIAQNAIAGVTAEPAQTFTGSNVQTGTEMPVPSPTAPAGAGTGAMVAEQPVAAPPNELLTPELETLPPPPTPQVDTPAQTDAQPVVPELLTPAQLQSYGQAQDVTNAQARLDAAMAAQDRAAAELAMMTLTGAKAGSGPLATRAVRAQDEAVTLAILSARPVNAVAMERWAQYPATNAIGPDGNIPRRGIPAKYAKQGDVYVHAEAAQAQVSAGKTQGGGFKNLNVSGRTAGFLNTDILNEATDLLRSGITDFANWSRAMVSRFGRAIQEFLAGIWQQVTSPQTNAAQNVRMGRAQGTAPVTLGNSGAVLNPAAAPSRAAAAPNETQSRFASPNEAARVINGPRTDAMVADQARRWLDSVDTQTAVEQFVAQAVPLPLDAAEHAAAVLISRLTSESTTNGTEVQRLWAHVQSQRMARVWTREFLSADPARALRQRGVVNNTILQPIAPVMAAQGILVDRADAVMDKRFEGGGAGAVEKITRILNDVQGDITERVEAILNAVMGARLKPRVTIREAVAGLVNGKTQRDEMIDDVARALLQKAKSSQVKPEQKTALAALVASLKRTLGAAVRGKPLKPDALSFGELLARTFVDQVAEAPMFEESWKAGREQVRLMLIELGMTESAALKRLNELMPATPTVAYAPGMVKQAVQRGFEAAGYGQTLATGADQSGQRAVDVRAEVLRNPQRAMEAVMRVWDEEAQAGGISPEAWAQGRPLAVRALNETLQQWQQQAAETTAKAAEATKNRLLAKDSPALAKLLKELAAKIAPGMNWAEIFTDMPSTQKARQIEIYRRLMLDERLQGLTQDERLALTNELDKAWQRERRKVFNRELEKAGVLGETDKTDRVKVQKALPKLLRMINLGMFNSEMWREAVAPEYGLRMLTAADTAQLRTLAEAAWKLPEGVIRNQKLRDLLNAIQKKTGASWIEVLNSYWTTAVLSGLRTQFDTWLAAINGMGTNLMQIGGLMARGQGRAAIDAHAQWWRGLFEGVRESGQILFKGDTSYLKRFGADLKKALEGETSVTPVPMGENLWRDPDAKTAAGRAFQKYGLAPVMLFTGRLMAAADHINNTATTQGAIAVARALHPELYQGRVGFTASERADARTQALREVTGGAEPKPGQERATVSARTREILNGTVKPADYAAASEIGDMAAYQNDPTGVFGIVYSAMKQGLGSIQRGLGDYAQDVTANRFARVISGLMAGSLHGITGTRFMRFGANFGADLTRYIPGSYVLGKAGFYGRDVSRMQQELLLGKNLVGLMLASTLAAIFLNSDDEDEGWQIEGDWSTLNPQQAKERMAAGYERLTMWKREGGKVRRVSYKQWPTMGLFAVVGGMLDEKRHKPASWAERGTAGHLLHGVATGYTQVMNVSAVRNLVELFGEPSFSSDKVSGTIDQMIKTGTGFAGGFMPTLMKDAEAWTDPRSFKPEGAAELMLRSMPIARKFVNDGRPQLNLLGEEVKLQRTPWSRAYTSVESGEAHRVLGALLARGLSLPMPSDEVTVIKDNVRVPLETLGRDAVWRYEKAVGQGYKDWLSLEGSDLLKLPVQEADARIKARSAAIKARAKASVVK